jgi:hypothetical protein
MAAPVFAQWYSYSFRDAKGQVARMRVLIGGASAGAVETASQGFKTEIQATTNAFVWLPNQDGPLRTYGTAANYQDVEDKMILTFHDPAGYLHRYQVAAPLLTDFLTDQETVNSADANVSSLLGAFAGNIYGRPTDTAALVYIGGVRIRRKLIRRFNILTLNPAETGPGE